MPPTGPQTVYVKTAKGNLEIRNRTVKLPRDAGLVFLSIDGKATVAELLPRSGMNTAKLEETLDALVAEGYIEPLPDSGTRTGPEGAGTGVPQGIDKLSADAATHAAKESDATKRAREAARAALDARLRQESEARARLLAEARAQAEVEAQTKAQAAVRAALQDKARAQAEADAAKDAVERDRAEARARAAAAVAVRAEAEARARAANADRAKALANTKRAGEQKAREEAEEKSRIESEAQAEAAAAARARNLLEAQLRVMSATRADPSSESGSGGMADEARKLTILSDSDVSERARELTARVQSERRAREEADRKAREALLTEDGTARPGTKLPDDGFPRLELGDRESGGAKKRATGEVTPQDAEFADPMVKHAPTALERAMAQQAALARPQPGGETAPAPAPAASKPSAMPTLAPVPAIDRKSTLRESASADRATHDDMVQSVEPRVRAAAASRDAVDLARDQARRAAAARRTRRRRHFAAAAVIALLALPALGIAWLQFAPLDGYIPEAERAIADRLNQPVKIASVRYVLLPSPRLILQGLSIGTAQGIRADRIEAYAWPFAVLGEPKRFSRVEATNVSIDPAMLVTLPSWTGGRSASAVHVSRLHVTNLRLNVPGADLAPLEGEVTFAPNGTVNEALLTNDNLKITLSPRSGSMVLKVDANAWTPPFGPPLAFSYFNATGVLNNDELKMNEFSGRIAGGYIQATGTARWSGPLAIDGTFALQNVRLEELLPALTDNLSAKGALK
ncbi:MAG: hypothetical protein ACXW2I_02860, partial [Burkholderiales bacterium]